MKRVVLGGLAVAIAVGLFAHAALAQAAFQFAIPNVRIPGDADVSGVRFSFLHGENRSQRGLDLGLFSISETSELSGLALIGGMSRVTRGMPNGAAFGLVNWHSGRDSGVNAALVNILADARDAFNTGFVTVATGATGFDLGGFNQSRRSTAQIGFVNVTDHIESFQFGFINIAKNGFFPVFPVVNLAKR